MYKQYNNVEIMSEMHVMHVMIHHALSPPECEFSGNICCFDHVYKVS